MNTRKPKITHAQVEEVFNSFCIALQTQKYQISEHGNDNTGRLILHFENNFWYVKMIKNAKGERCNVFGDTGFSSKDIYNKLLSGIETINLFNNKNTYVNRQNKINNAFNQGADDAWNKYCGPDFEHEDEEIKQAYNNGYFSVVKHEDA